MPDGSAGLSRPWGEAIHATAVAICGRGLVILGPSRSGKSRLAFALMAASTSRQTIRLIGDDRILLTPGADGCLVARPHPRVAGFIERRGLGIVAVPHLASAPVVALVDFGLTTLPPVLAQNLPIARNVYHCCEPETPDLRDHILAWWRGACTTPTAKPSVPSLAEARD